MEKTFLTIFRHWSVLILLVVTERHSPIIEVFLEVMFESCQLWSLPKGQGFLWSFVRSDRRVHVKALTSFDLEP